MSIDVVTITGMHRSGTSLVARIVNLLGVDLGAPSSLMQPKPDNPTGFWESLPVAQFNDDLLAELGGRWDHPPIPRDGWERDSRFDPWRTRAREIVSREFADTVTAGWKDPRMSIVVPFWRTVVDMRTTIVVVRHPGAVASSLEQRDGTDPEHAARLWLIYTIAALHNAPGAHVVRYEEFFDDFDATLDRLAGAVASPRPAGDARAEIADFFDPELSHHSASTPAGPIGETATWLYESAVWPLPTSTTGLLWDGLREAYGGAEAGTALLRRLADVERQRQELENTVRHVDRERARLSDELETAQHRIAVHLNAMAREERIGRLLRDRLDAAIREAEDAKAELAQRQADAERRHATGGGR